VTCSKYYRFWNILVGSERLVEVVRFKARQLQYRVGHLYIFNCLLSSRTPYTVMASEQSTHMEPFRPQAPVISITGRHFTDTNGRVLDLRGANVGSSSKV
jgi:hypothetical protein